MSCQRGEKEGLFLRKSWSKAGIAVYSNGIVGRVGARRAHGLDGGTKRFQQRAVRTVVVQRGFKHESARAWQVASLCVRH